MTQLLIRGGRVIDPASGFDQTTDLRVVDGRVAAIGPAGGGGADRVIDATGCTVAPGFDFAGFEMAPEGWAPTSA